MLKPDKIEFSRTIHYDLKVNIAFDTASKSKLITLLTPYIKNGKREGTWFNVYDKDLNLVFRGAYNNILYIDKFLPESDLLNHDLFKPMNRDGYFDKDLFFLAYPKYCNGRAKIVTKTLLQIDPQSIRTRDQYMTFLALIKGSVMGIIKH